MKMRNAKSFGKQQQSGFTLVEIAIVLVIIGLLLGGILKGQELITQARIKNVINDFNGITAAVNSYRDRYRTLPGDDPQAAARWATPTPAAVNGNGNGVVEGLYNSTAVTDESRLFWDHLRRSGFVAGNGTDLPANSLSGSLGVQTGNGSATPTPVLGTFSGLIMCSTSIPDRIAGPVDTQMDDGRTNSGQIRAAAQGPGVAIPRNASTMGTYTEAGTTFTLCGTI